MGGRHRGDRDSPCGTGELTLVPIIAVFGIIPIFAVFSIVTIFAVFSIAAGSPGNCSDRSLSIR